MFLYYKLVNSLQHTVRNTQSATYVKMLTSGEQRYADVVLLF
jgi:hypothetical protein